MAADVPLPVLLTREPGDEVWVAHCLDFDIVTQGEGIEGAFAALVEAVQLVFDDDDEHGFDSTQRRSAPEEAWREFDRILHNRTRTRVEALSEEQLERVCAVIGFVTLHVEDAPVPPAWQLAALDTLRSDGPSSRPS